MSDIIRITGLRLVSRIGVPEEERALPQSLSANVAISLAHRVGKAGDTLEATVDYYQVAAKLREVAAAGERLLIETLAEDLASAVLGFQGVTEVTVEVEKFILPDCDSVSIEITRAVTG